MSCEVFATVPGLYAVWLCSALCPRHKCNHSLQLYDRWLVWLDGWANVQPEHPASMAAFSSTSSFHIGLDQRRNWYPSHVGEVAAARENECFCDGLDQ
eukprot:scaffold542_cov103-Skeletonema_marinoi.AAC.3